METYLVYYCETIGGDSYETNIFCTNDENIAIRYCNKFNSKLELWKQYFHKFADPNLGWFCGDYDVKFDRWYQIVHIDRCRYIKLPFKTK